jgi:hypothetical protein
VAVRWSGYDEGLGTYQGELLHKTEHTKTFLEKMKRREDYDCSKLETLWRHLIATCTAVALETQNAHTRRPTD